MNVVILSDHDSQGGAAVAAGRVETSVALELEKVQGNVSRFVHFPDGTHRPIRHLWHEETPLQRLLYRIPRKVMPARFPHPNSPAFAAAKLRALLKTLQPDIINIHNLHAAGPWGWGPHLIEVCLEFASVVWTLHDMWSFTGRCAYSYDCEKFITGCDASCPTPTELPVLAPEKIRGAWEERRAIYDRHREDLVIVTPSRWLAKQARRGMFACHRIEVIPYGLPPTGRPVPLLEARRTLGINPAGPVLLLAAFDLTERRKGAEVLPHVWRHVQTRPLTVLTMGRGSITIDDPRIEVHALGWIDDDDRKQLAYSAADALLHPAPVDNFPNVVLEAFACGTPAIALPVGGLPEMVRPDVSGWLADAATPAALGLAVDRALGNLSQGRNLRDSCGALAEKEYSLDLQGERYFQVFQQLRRR